MRLRVDRHQDVDAWLRMGPDRVPELSLRKGLISRRAEAALRKACAELTRYYFGQEGLRLGELVVGERID